MSRFTFLVGIFLVVLLRLAYSLLSFEMDTYYVSLLLVYAFVYEIPDVVVTLSR